ncbi:DUF805 domain-containing protein [Lactococcus formosensis]|uniref:DUF805 domain-containing protein n=1 Tax=Lactococcus formosensis TaxID=1281486 RepID=A0A9X4SJ00_9LACT|nr:DUF805 domain-containing protein [Lactococcus formosensis]MDG6142335.1 DUF805 domain-containing protein [Lactococcus formosensis]MDG6159540.1 DUF805 domain-containing protein [Lactococcus formosensis]MDG6165774.1 DUF805 domain-containing protein [Lactococcus formosensis]MDG6172227.1 DUF805 domain-containing protein [Lactococcus formosensis]MDG6192994.1 DUF805 domain-containing protein [Lactococcus formosensis]
MFNLKEFKQSYQKFWLGYISFKERTSRKDYWLAMLGHILVTVILLVFATLFHLLSSDVLPDLWSVFSYFFIALWVCYGFIAFCPFLAMAVRRLRDVGLPWELIFVLLAPFGGFFAILILNALPAAQAAADLPEFLVPTYGQARIEENGQENFLQAIKNYFLGYISFRGRTSRLSFWFVQLIFALVFAVLGVMFVGIHFFENVLFGGAFIATWMMLTFLFLVGVGFLMPTLALFTRRLRDAGLSNYGIGLIFFVALSLFLLSNISHAVDAASFGIHDFTLFNYLLFLADFVFAIILLFVLVQDKDQLLQEEKTLLFRRKG